MSVPERRESGRALGLRSPGSWGLWADSAAVAVGQDLGLFRQEQSLTSSYCRESLIAGTLARELFQEDCRPENWTHQFGSW